MREWRSDHAIRMDALATRAFDRHLIKERSDSHWLLMRPRASDPANRRFEKEGYSPWDNPKTRWTGTFWVEIRCLHGGKLYVGGDIEPVIFSSCTADGEARVRWMGERKSGCCHYLQEKACAGTGREVIYRYDREEAERQVNEFIAECMAEREFEPDSLGALVENAIEEYSGEWENDISLRQHLLCATALDCNTPADIAGYRLKIREVPDEGLLDFLRDSLQVIRTTPTGQLAEIKEIIDDGFSEDRRTFFDSLYSLSNDEHGLCDWLSEAELGMVPAPRLYYAWAALRRLCDLLDKEKKT